MNPNKTVEIIVGDITKLKVDAIVNAANTSLLGGGGVDGAIHAAAGPRLSLECASLGGARPGQAKITKGYDLPAKFIIHTVGPVYQGGNSGESKVLANCYTNSLILAAENRIRTIAFPAISTGAYRFPKQQAAKIAYGTVMEFLAKYPSSFDRIIFVVYSEGDRLYYDSAVFKD